MSTSRRGPSSLGQRESPLRSGHRAYKRLPAKARNPPEADLPRDGVPSFVLERWKFGAPDRMKLGTRMLLFVRYNF